MTVNAKVDSCAVVNNTVRVYLIINVCTRSNRWLKSASMNSKIPHKFVDSGKLIHRKNSAADVCAVK